MKKRFVLIGIISLLLAAPSLLWASAFDDFFTAIKRDDDRTLRALLQRGFDVNTIGEEGQHPLYLALREGSKNSVAVLLEHPSLQVEYRNERGESLLMMAALKGQIGPVRRLIERRAEVNKPGWTALHYAATYAGPEAVELVRLLLEHHAYIDASSPNESTPLMMAAQYGHPRVLQLLLDEGADPTIKNEQGLTAIDFARRAGREAAAQSIAAAIRERQPKGRW